MTTRGLTDIFGQEAILSVKKPISEARGLPAAAYTSQEVFDLEQERLFRETWIGVAFTSDVARPGDAIPLIAAGIPMILCRDRSGEIRAFHNVCRHRASIILREPAKQLSMFSCPYHAWTYNLDGQLRATPFYDGTRTGEKFCIAKEENGLVPIRVGVWNHWVFVNLDGKAPPLEQYLAPVVKLLAGFDIGTTNVGHREDWEVEANWKLQNDNWETYHHVALHKGIFTKMSDDLEFETGKPWNDMRTFENAVCLWRREGSVDYASSPSGLPLIPLRPSEIEPRRCTTLVFPNVTITLTPDHVASVITDPLAPNRTLMKMAFFFVGDAASAPEMADSRKVVLDRWLGKSRAADGRDGIRSQDMGMWEGQQIARRSSVANDVKFSPTWEINVHHFQNWFVDRLR